jgi:endoglycosylceramidase
MGRRFQAGALALVLAAATMVGAGTVASADPAGDDVAVVAPRGRVAHAGRWLVDRDGRVVLVHGVNMPTKELPAFPAHLGFGDDDAALLAANGFNAVRLTVERYAVEPTPGHFDEAYVAQFADTVEMLARHGILSLIDFHQDEYGPVFFDNGFPEWMTMTDGLPNVYQVGFPAQYLLNPALNRAYDHLWANDVGPSGRRLQDDDADILAFVAARLAGHRGVMGYDIINEPWPGSQYPTCFVPVVGCPLFDRGEYRAYNARMIAVLRAADPHNMIWYEPLVSFNYGVPTWMLPPADPRLGFSFHDYPLCSATADAGLPVSLGGLCSAEESLALSNAIAHSSATGNALLLTEFGASTDVAALTKQLDLYDGSMIPWMFWSYTRYLDAYASDGRTLAPATGTNPNAAMLDVLARPYPQLVAGTPIAWKFDPAAKAFTFRYSTRRVGRRGAFAAGSETDISVPARQYPHGYVAHVTGGTVVSPPNAPVLRVRAPGGRHVVNVAISPRP